MTQGQDLPLYLTGAVTSRDGTSIGYRQVGHGPGIIAVHGAGQAAQNLMGLASALANAFTVYLPDRRGRGLSGPPGDHYSLKAECEDLDALLERTGARCVFGLSSGAIICLQAALTLPAIYRVALYAPPLSINGSTPTGWVARYERELAAGNVGGAMLTAVRGTQTAPLVLRFLPRYLLAPLLNSAARMGTVDNRVSHERWLARQGPIRRAVLRLVLWPLRRQPNRGFPGRAGSWQRRCPAGHARAHDPLRRTARDRCRRNGRHVQQSSG